MRHSATTFVQPELLLEKKSDFFSILMRGTKPVLFFVDGSIPPPMTK